MDFDVSLRIYKIKNKQKTINVIKDKSKKMI